MKLSPKMATTAEKVCALNRDNISFGNFWMITDADYVVIAHQHPGESVLASINIPRSEFIKLINWYQRPQKVRRRKS